MTTQKGMQAYDDLHRSPPTSKQRNDKSPSPSPNHNHNNNHNNNNHNHNQHNSNSNHNLNHKHSTIQTRSPPPPSSSPPPPSTTTNKTTTTNSSTITTATTNTSNTNNHHSDQKDNSTFTEQHWKTQIAELRTQHHVEIQRLKKGYELQITALNVEIHRLKAQLEDRKAHNSMQAQINELKLRQSNTSEAEQLQKQLNDMKEMTLQREKASKVLLQEVNDQWINFKTMAEGELNMLRQRLADFEEGNVQILLRIDLEENIKNRVGAPKRPAPLRPQDISPAHSRQSSQSSVAYEQALLTSEALARHTQMTDVEDMGDELPEQSYARINGILSGKSVVKDGSPTPGFEAFSDAAKEALARKLQLRHKRSASTVSGRRIRTKDVPSVDIKEKETVTTPDGVVDERTAYQRYTNPLQTPKQMDNKLTSPLTPPPVTNGTHNKPLHNGGEIYSDRPGPNRLHKPAASASHVIPLVSGKSEPFMAEHRIDHDQQRPQSSRAHQVPPQFRASVTGGGIAAQEWASTSRRKPQGAAPPLSSSRSYRSLSRASSGDGSLSISEIDKYIGVDENGNSKIPEELKTSQEQLKALQQLDQNKYKQLQIKYASERKNWMEKAKELQDQVTQMEQTLKYTQNKLRDKLEQNVLLQDQCQTLQRQFEELPAQTRAEAQERFKFKQIEQSKIHESQQALYQEINTQRQQIAQMQGVIEQQQFTIETLQNELTQTKDRNKERIRALEKKIEETQSSLAKQVPSTSKELLQQQIKVLKTQRKVLVKEIKDLREQNELLKNMIVNGGRNAG